MGTWFLHFGHLFIPTNANSFAFSPHPAIIIFYLSLHSVGLVFSQLFCVVSTNGTCQIILLKTQERFFTKWPKLKKRNLRINHNNVIVRVPAFLATYTD